MFEDEKRKRLYDIESSIEKLNISSSDKEKLKKEVESLNKEQKSLQNKIDDLEKEFDQEKVKKRQVEKELNELQINMNTKLISGQDDESTRVKYLRDEISKKQMQITSAQREYKSLIDQKIDYVNSSPEGKGD